METRIPHHFEFFGVRRQEWYNISVYPSGDGISVFWRDITNNKQVEAQRDRLLRANRDQLEMLYRERTRLESVLNQSPLGIMVADMEGNIQFWNPAAQQMLGKPVLLRNFMTHDLTLCYPDGGFVPTRERPLVKSALEGMTHPQL